MAETELSFSVGQIFQFLWIVIIPAIMWFAKREIKRREDWQQSVDTRLSELEGEQDNTMLLKEIGRNEGSIEKLHERADDIQERVVKVETWIEHIRTKSRTN